MVKPVITPLSQALSEGTLSRAELRSLMARSDRAGLTRLAIWIGLVAATAGLVWLSLGSWWLLPAMFIHGIVLVHHFSLQHECVHYTVFRTRGLNNIVGNFCAIVIMLPHQFFRYEHCDHHTYTQIAGDDPELIPLPAGFGAYLLYISALPYWRTKFAEIARHFAGRLTSAEKKFVPESEYAAVILEARIMVLIFAAVFATMIALDWWAPLWFWFLPVAMAEPVMRFIRMTEHVGRPLVAQMRQNTRTNTVSLPWRFLCWNMNYHAEHHYASSVPFHALPRLHKTLKDQIYIEKHGYLGAHKDILRQISVLKRGSAVEPV
ncbi:MAG: fatty acid desaturase [Alphaproteobacteria bacterium]